MSEIQTKIFYDGKYKLKCKCKGDDTLNILREKIASKISSDFSLLMMKI